MAADNKFGREMFLMSFTTEEIMCSTLSGTTKGIIKRDDIQKFDEMKLDVIYNLWYRRLEELIQWCSDVEEMRLDIGTWKTLMQVTASCQKSRIRTERKQVQHEI